MNKKIDKILVPIDGSKNSIRGLEMAISIGVNSGAVITGVYSLGIIPHSEFQVGDSIERGLNKEIKKTMKEAATLTTQKGIKFRERIMRGDPGYNIIKLAHDKKENYDLIVIGSRGRGTIKELFLGSVSNYVVHASKIPVLIVK